MKYFIFSILPKSLLSRTFGVLASARTPLWAPLFKQVFASLYRLNTQEMEKPMSAYPTLQALFTRRLKAGARHIAEDFLVSPVDGRLSQWGDLDDPRLKMIQAKGRYYSLGDMLQDQQWAEHFVGGQWATIYLAPFNYHRIHSPVEGQVGRVRHIPGHLWPVNQWSVHNVSDLFCVNERIITEMITPNGGRCLVVKVGATNVGRISLTFCPWVSNRPGQFGLRDWSKDQKIHLDKGAELGCFELGSTVILVLDAQARQDGLFQNHLGKAVRVGQSLA